MELGLFWRSLRQRWYLVLALLVLTGGATFLVAQRVGPTYEATGTVLVFPPSQSEGPTGELSQGNPYLSLGGVNQARDVVVRALTAKKVSDEFGKEYPPGTSYEIVPDYTNSAPIILFTVEAAAPDDAAAALEFLMGRVPAELEKLQAGLDLPAVQQVTSVTLTQDEEPAPTNKAMLRASIMTGAVIAGVGLLLIALVDGLLAARRRGAGEPADESADESGDESGEEWDDEESGGEPGDRPEPEVAEADEEEWDERPEEDADRPDDSDEPPRAPVRLERRREARATVTGNGSGSGRTVTSRMVRRRSTPGERGEAS